MQNSGSTFSREDTELDCGHAVEAHSRILLMVPWTQLLCGLLCSMCSVTFSGVPAGPELFCSPPTFPSGPLAAVTMHSHRGQPLGLPS